MNTLMRNERIIKMASKIVKAQTILTDFLINKLSRFQYHIFV